MFSKFWAYYVHSWAILTTWKLSIQIDLGLNPGNGRMSFQNFFLKTCHSHGWWKWQAYFQYLVHQFASHFSSIEFEFNSSCMQCHWIFLFKWNFIYVKSTHLKIVSLSLIVCNNLEPKFDSSSKLWFLQFDSSFSFLFFGYK